MRIAHIADIHWRGLSRHDEYREIFSTFVDSCKLNKVDHIFIGGDIFHTKTTGISPEYIEQLSWWLTAMSEVATVHMILGNHDGNLVNLSRQDAISPIVTALNNDKVHLYKKSGVYDFAEGYSWCVFSLFDEEGWGNVVPHDKNVNIACYHGPVCGSVSETGWGIEEGKKIEFFENYDFTFLGDIHKYQVLGKRNEKPWIAYPGTPIQQNYSEDLEHGYLLWDIRSKNDWDVNFVKLPNPKPFVTLNWTGSVKSFSKDCEKFPKGARFRIKSDQHISQKEVQQISSFLNNEKSATEVTYKSEIVIDKSSIRTGTASLVKSDLRSSDVLIKLIKDHHKNVEVSIDTWEKVSDLVKSTLSTVTLGEDISRNSKWSLRYLGFDNMFTYGEGNHVNFDSLNGIVGIFGSNRIGKSSVVGTIMYSLFNTTDRGPMKNIHVCNVRKPYCYSKAVINHNGTDYVIERQTTKSENKKGAVSASTSLNLYQIKNDGEAVELNGEQRNDTEKVIRSLIGSSEDFLMTSLSAQGEINQFIMQGSSKRRTIMSRFLDLDIFDKMHEIVNKESNIIKAQLKNYPEKDCATLIDQAKLEIHSLENAITQGEETIQEKRKEYANLDNELRQHGNQHFVTKEQVDQQKLKIQNLKLALDAEQKKLLFTENEIEESNKKILTIKDIRQDNDLAELKKQSQLYKDLETSLISLRHSFEKEDSSLKQQQKSLKILDDVPCGDEYPQCKFIKDAHQNKKKIAAQEKTTNEAKAKLNESLGTFSKLESKGILEKIEKLEKLISLESKLELDVSKKENELAKIKIAYDACKQQHQDSIEKLTLLEGALNAKENAEVTRLKSLLVGLNAVIKNLDNEKIENATKKGKLSALIEKLAEEKSHRDELLENLKAHELIASAFSKKGIPLVITRSQIPAINAEISKILHGIVEFSIELENEDDSDTSEIYINYGDSRRVIELCSGMEKTIASLAVRVALINMSSLPKPDIFIIDEGFGTLDDTAVEACNRLLTSLKRYFKVIVVITHVDGIKDVVDTVLEITKQEKDAKLIYGE
jgi:DNA repair exonuclease SbcCD ATPase subunit/DNA repair exonuclease SbcCD nuclease subunit